MTPWAPFFLGKVTGKLLNIPPTEKRLSGPDLQQDMKRGSELLLEGDGRIDAIDHKNRKAYSEIVDQQRPSNDTGNGDPDLRGDLE
jgi:hypothetical protein